MSKIFIENYRGFDIEFDTTYEKFQCLVTDEDAKESTSFTAVKKFIDDYKKANQEFNPFYVISVPSRTSRSDHKRYRVMGVRKDGRFIAETEDGSRTQISDYDLKYYMLDKDENNQILLELDAMEENHNKVREVYSAKRDVLLGKLNVITLKDYKETLL